MGQQTAAHSARSHALAVLRARNGAVALGLLPAAVALVLLAAGGTGHLAGGWAPGRWTPLHWATVSLAAGCLLLGAGLALVVGRARSAPTPAVEVPEPNAPGLHALIRELADRLDVPAPAGVALTPDCDCWLEERRTAAGPRAPGSVLVVGSPFLWWMRVDELRALLAPVVAGTGPSAHPDIAAARDVVRGLDAAVADGRSARDPLRVAAGLVARAVLRSAGPHAAEMERGVAAAAAARARSVDYGLRIAAQEQVSLAYAGWDRLLTRVALPAWRTQRWPRQLNAGVVAALTELSRRDRLAEGFAPRLGERPACDLLEEPGAVDEDISLLAARVFHGAPDPSVPTVSPIPWAPVDWDDYPHEVVDRAWRERAARLFITLDAAAPPTLDRVLEHLGRAPGPDRADALAAGLAAAVARTALPASAEAALPPDVGDTTGPAGLAGAAPPPVFPPQPPRSGRDLLVEHLTAAVCCAAVDCTVAAPGLDWLDGPVLHAGGERHKDVTGPVQGLVDDGDEGPLRAWLADAGVSPDKPLRLV